MNNQSEVGIPIPTPKCFGAEGTLPQIIFELTGKGSGDRNKASQQDALRRYLSKDSKSCDTQISSALKLLTFSLGDRLRIRKGSIILRKLSPRCHLCTNRCSGSLPRTFARIGKLTRQLDDTNGIEHFSTITMGNYCEKRTI